MNGNKWLENNGWECMRSHKIQECLTREMGWRLQLVLLTEVMRCERAGVYQTRLVCTYQHAQDSNRAIYRVLEVRRSFTTLSNLLSLFLLYIQIHTDLRILLSFITVTQELIEPYLSEIYSFLCITFIPFIRSVNKRLQFLKPSYEKAKIGTTTVCTQLTGFIFIHSCACITHSTKKVQTFNSNTVIQPCSRLTNLN